MSEAVQAAVVFGATGGIGRELYRQILASGRFAAVHGLGRSALPGETVDITDEGSVAAAAARLAAGPPIGIAIVATGLLHRPGLMPERSWRQLDPAILAELFAVNVIGPALVAKHVLPLLPRRGRATFAVLSARVGSIGDNRLGGWYGYRSSKAALNQMLRTLAIELARTHPEAVCLGLHPGTVATALSEPFRANVPGDKLFTPARAASRLLAVIDAATPEDSGRVLAWDGQVVPP